MEIESKSSLTIRFIRLTFVVELALFFITSLFCLILHQFNWNGFFTGLFFVGFLAIIIGNFFGKSIDLVPKSNLFAGNNDNARKLEGSPIFMYTTMLAGAIAIVLSIIIPLLFSGQST